LERALALGDKAVIGRAQGVGPKLATRIATELKDKVPSMMAHAGEAPAIAAKPAGPEVDALLALVKLGYSQGQATEAVARTARELGDVGADVLIRESLRSMGR
jgi:Holliday junction DNA helicase RuvA